MQYTLEKGPASNYAITATMTQDDLATYKNIVLKGFQKDMKVPGFRPGHVPLAMVEQQANPGYIDMGIIEEGINDSIQKVLEEHKDISFIGQIYGVDTKQEGDNKIVSYNLDVYPAIVTNNTTWKTEGVFPIDTKVSDEEIADSFKNLQRQYADYTDTDTIGEDTVSKVKFVSKDASDSEVDKGSLFLGNEEYTEFPALTGIFYGKKTGDIVTLDYNEEQLPMMFHSKNKEQTATTIEVTIADIKVVQLPEFTDEQIIKFFGAQDDVKNVADLKTKIAGIMLDQKKSHDLAHTIEHLIKDAAPAFTFMVPQTLVASEIKTRNESLEEKLGGAKGLEKYYEQLGSEATTKMKEEIQAAAEQSLAKFFVLKAIVDELGLEVNRDAAGDVEQKIYDTLPKKTTPHVH